MNGRRMIAAGVVAGAVTVGAVAGALIGIPGLSGATSSSGASGASGATGATGATGESPHIHGFFGHRGDDGNGVLDAAAKALDLSTKDLLEKLSDGKTTIADVAGQQNVDVQTVIDAMEAVAKQDIENLVNNPLPARPDFPEGRRGGHGFGLIFGMPGMGKALDPIAKALGVTTDELQTDLRNGQSIADIAKAKGVDLSTIVDAVVKEAQARFDQAVKDGKLSRDQADKIQANLKDMITSFLNNDMPKGLGGLGRWRMHGGPGRFGPDGPWPGAPGEASPSAAAAI